MYDEAKMTELLALRRGALDEAMPILSIQAQSARIKDMFGSLYTGVLDILQRYDPIGIMFEKWFVVDDEYSIVADTIMLRLHEAHSIAEMQRVIYEEFVWWFSGSGIPWEQRLADHIAGPEENYTEIAREIWELWSGQRLPEQQ